MPHRGVAREVDEVADQRLPEIVGGMGLAREHELHRIGGEQEVPQPPRLRQEQGGALVRGEAAREADRQHLRVEHVVAPLDVGGGEAPGHGQRDRPDA